jgi:hypothetical protein
MAAGYDIGGAEYPMDPENLTVVDILKPMEPVDWFQRDLNVPNWSDGLKPRPTIYIGKVLRYLDRDRLAPLGREVDSIWSIGELRVFDHMDVIDPFIAAILMKNEFVHVVAFHLINPPDEDAAEWEVILEKRP